MFVLNDEISKLFYEWNIENTGNYLLEITSKILTKKEGNNYLIDLILDKSGNKGTGSWSSKTALDLGFPSTMITAAVFDRYISSFKKDRVQFSKNITRETHLNSPKIVSKPKIPPPILPSHVFLGEILSNNLCFPNDFPTK